MECPEKLRPAADHSGCGRDVGTLTSALALIRNGFRHVDVVLDAPDVQQPALNNCWFAQVTSSGRPTVEGSSRPANSSQPGRQY